MFFHSEPLPISHVTSSLRMFLQPSSPGSFITLYNGAAVSSSSGADSLYFDGINDYADFTGSLNTITQNAYTISMWVKMSYDNVSKNRIIMTNYLNSLPSLMHGFKLSVQNGAVLANIINNPYNGPGAGALYISTSTTNEGRVDDNNWHNIVVTSNGGQAAYGGGRINQNIKIFLNKLENTGAGGSQGSPSLWFLDNVMKIGFSYNVGGGFPFDGHISNILFYDKELSLAEIQQNYDAFKNKFGR
jgi:hypothetical protein